MKKLFAVLLVAVLMLSVSACAMAEGASDPVPFNPKLSTLMEYSTSEWMEDNGSRAFLTATICCDLVLSNVDDLFDFELTNDIYVGRSGLNIVICYYNDTTILSVFYTPMNDEASYILMDSVLPSTVAQKAVKDFCGTCYTVDGDDFLICIEAIMEALEENVA